MYLSAGNIATRPDVALLFIDFARPARLRVNGRASIEPDDPLLARWHEAQLVVRIAVRTIFMNCPRYVHTATRSERSPFVPERGRETPVPEWKRSDTVQEALPARDRDRLNREQA